MADTRKYLDYEGLNQFWSSVKDYFNNPVNKVQFKGSKEAEFKPLEIEVSKGLDGKRTVQVALDLSQYALLSDVAAALHFRGVVEKKANLPATAEVGDVYIVKYRDDGRDWNCEFVWTDKPEAHWEELGGIVDLSNYYTKKETEDLVDQKVLVETENRKAADTELETNLTNKLNQEISDRKDAIELLRTDLEEKLDAEVLRAKEAEAVLDSKITKAAADISKEIIDRNRAIDYAFNFDVHVIKRHEIKKLFGDGIPTVAADFLTNVGAAMTGDTILLQEDVTLASRLALTDGKDITLDMTGKTLTANSDRALDLRGASILEIKGGTVDCSQYPTVFVGDNAAIIVDGTVINPNNPYGVALVTNGNNVESVINVKGEAQLNGAIYAPACGTTLIDGAKIICGASTVDACAMYVKSGHLLIKDSVIQAAPIAKGDWSHNDNGYNGVGCALVIENCNYAGHGNVTVTIDDKTQFIPGPNGENFDNVGILIINRGENKCDNINIAQTYYTVDVPVDTNVHYFSKDGRDGSIKMEEHLF